jgi:hypothetical protein
MSDVGVPNRANRRLSARIACRLAVSYSTGAEWHPATGMDLSSHGCRLRLGEDLPRGSSLRVRIESPAVEGSEAMQAELAGTVIWSRLEGLSFQVGIQFPAHDPGVDRILATLG